ncbi:MAG: hypothetical protein ACRENI_08105 [Gemmatimonadaceae bacterium]
MSESISVDHPIQPAARYARLAFAALLAVYGVACLRHPERYRLLDSVDLAIHETGHLVFAAFGEFIGFAGGTLFQIIVPLVFVGYFLRRGDRYAAAVPLWWVAQNLWNISVYVRDARSQELPLAGGGEHDWMYLLSSLGLMQSDQVIADALHAVGVVVFGLSIIAAFYFAGDANSRN